MGEIGPYELNRIYTGDARILAEQIPDESTDLVFWSGPYFVGKSYEEHLTYQGWLKLLKTAVAESARILKPGSFLVINCADILTFPDPGLEPMRNYLPGRSLSVTIDDIVPLAANGLGRREIAAALGCSEQTVDRRLNGNNARGKKKEQQTRIELVAHHFAGMASAAGLYLYDRRVWVKDPAWQSCQWHTVSYRSIDESEHLLIFAKPGVITVDRNRLTQKEWADWGSRGVWYIPSVRNNDIHEAMFPLQLATRVVKLFSPIGGLVADLFIGAGTTARAAVWLERNYIGFEIDPDTAALARERVANTKPPLLVPQPEQLGLL